MLHTTHCLIWVHICTESFYNPPLLGFSWTQKFVHFEFTSHHHPQLYQADFFITVKKGFQDPYLENPRGKSCSSCLTKFQNRLKPQLRNSQPWPVMACICHANIGRQKKFQLTPKVLDIPYPTPWPWKLRTIHVCEYVSTFMHYVPKVTKYQITDKYKKYTKFIHGFDKCKSQSELTFQLKVYY